jgi:hypothetical protein
VIALAGSARHHVGSPLQSSARFGGGGQTFERPKQNHEQINHDTDMATKQAQKQPGQSTFIYSLSQQEAHGK